MPPVRPDPPPIEPPKPYQIRTAYRHVCGEVSHLPPWLAHAFARPEFVCQRIWCSQCLRHLPRDQFTWMDGSAM